MTVTTMDREAKSRCVQVMVLIAVIFQIRQFFLASQVTFNTTTIMTAPDYNVNASFTNQTSKQTTTHKPYFVFHVGIPKSGTTTIQCGLSKISGELASKDAYFYVGKPCPTNARLHNNETALGTHFMMFELNAGQLRYVGTKLKDRLQWHSKRNQSVILSSENFNVGISNKKGWDLLKNITQDFHVRIVVSYRRYFDWLPSFYFQHNHKAKKKMSLLTFIQNHLSKTTIHPTMEARNKYLPHFHDVQIFNMHQEGDLVTNFVCQTLPVATNVCNDRRKKQQTTTSSAVMSRQEQHKEVVVRPSSSFDFPRLIAGAKKLGYQETNKTKTRFDLFQTQHFSTYQQLSSCLSTELKQILLNRSMVFEENMVSSSCAANSNHHLQTLLVEHQKDHRDAFQKFLDKRKHCEINVTQALLNSSFLRFVFEEQDLQ